MGYNILLAVNLLFSIIHPIHISICEMEFDENRKALEITQRIFLDDLEKEIKKLRGEPLLDVLKPKNGLKTTDLFKDYILNHLSISVNGSPEDFRFLGYETEGNVVYMYLEIDKLRKLKEIAVKSTILTETYDDQVNLVHVDYQGEVNSLKLDSKTIEDALNWGN